jgi:colanic acid biosynthesis glycosyl transferase WcaI
MNILMIAPYYEPDLGPSAPLFTMLGVGLVKRGHKVTVITTVPHYPSGQISAAFRGRKIRRSSEKGVEVIRVPLPSLKRANLAKRLLQFLCYQFLGSWAGLSQQFEVALVANPALWVWLPFASLVFLRRKPSVFSVHDVYPDVGVKLGIFRHGPVIAAVSSLERFCLNRSSLVRILSKSFKPGLLKLGVPEERMALVYDWVDTDLIRCVSHNNAFSQEHDLTERFVVLYAGNLGLSQGLENVLTAAEQVINHRDLCFVFVGEGAGRNDLITQAEKKRLANVQFLPFQPRERLAEVLGSADVSLVILRRGIGAGSLPSKTFSVMASGRPVIVSVDEGSETWNLVKQAEAGICVPPENPSELAKAILTLKEDKDLRERLGRNGRIWAEQHHSIQSAAEKFEKLLMKAIYSEKSRCNRVKSKELASRV